MKRVRYTFLFRLLPSRSLSSNSIIFQNFQISVFDSDIRHSDKTQLQAAIDRYAEACGYDEITVLNESSGSWFKNIRYRIAKLISQEIQEEGIQTGQEFYRSGKSYALNKLEKTGVESTKQIAEATAEILKAVENLDDVVLLLGKLIVMKYTNDEGRSKTYVKTISSDLQLKLESTPQLLDSPQAIINFLKSQEELPTAIEDRKTLTAPPEPLK